MSQSRRGLETVSAAEEEQSNENDEVCVHCAHNAAQYDCFYSYNHFTPKLTHRVRGATLAYILYIVNPLQTEQAIKCLIEIAKKGKTAAEQYKEDPPNKVCKEMAEAFLG